MTKLFLSAGKTFIRQLPSVFENLPLIPKHIRAIAKNTLLKYLLPLYLKLLSEELSLPPAEDAESKHRKFPELMKELVQRALKNKLDANGQYGFSCTEEVSGRRRRRSWESGMRRL